MRAYRLARGTWDVLLLADDQGRCTVMEVIQELETRGGRGMLALLRNRVARLGPPRDNPDLCSHVEDDIWEFKKGSLRVFWFYDEGKVVVAAHAYKKQGQRAPRRHIETSKALRATYAAAKRTRALTIEDLVGMEGM
jgi:phage-related protein